MNGQDLLNAFQNIDKAYLQEAEHRTMQQKATEHSSEEDVWFPDLRERKEHTMNNKLWQLAIGAAAVIAVGSIAAVGAAAIQPERGMRVAYQPEGEETDAYTDSKELLAKEREASAVETEPLPEDLAEETATVEPVTELSYDEDLMISAINSFHTFAFCSGDDLTPVGSVDYDGGQICLTLRQGSSEAKQGAPESLTARIVVVQDGQVLPIALSENGETALWQDTDVQVGFGYDATYSYSSVWVTPLTTTEYSTVSMLVTYAPETMVNACHETAHHITMHTLNPNPEAAPSHAVAADWDFVDYPDGAAHKVIIEGSNYPPTDIAVTKGDVGFGIEIGSPINYADIPWTENGDGTGCYPIYEEERPDAYSRGELYLRANQDVVSEAAVRDYGATNLFAVVLCDGKPISALNGENAVWFDKTDGSQTLNYRLTLDDSVSDGMHLFSAYLIGDNHTPEYYAPTFGGQRSAVLNIVS